MMLRTADLDFVLPPELEAREPAELRGSGRDDVRLMVSDRATGDITHARFRDLPQFLRRGDLLVLNTTATLPAALRARRENGEEIALHYSASLPGGLAVVEPRGPAGEGEALSLPGGASARLLVPYRNSKRLWIAQMMLGEPQIDYLYRHGKPITYKYIVNSFPIGAYQNVYAQEEGSAEMPSAGRAFTRPMLACLRRGGVNLAKLVLHTGVASLESHEAPYDEWYEVPLRTANLVRATRRAGGRVIAVGTTVVRALESSVDRDGNSIASRGWTDLVITPERGVRMVDGILTGLHEPRATHLAMLQAIAGREPIEKAYAAALEHGYLWHEFGDLHLIV
ncbi:MAG TPA: S-adenosylmethionine:tRNA ribosyltransferase-isomerase [Thermoanaerobaculia bacterium]|nr:S-adenosylmethionine:tRNA ribosyltransferase-isomerase [Thermoanaerobaculia bacterium]